MTRAILPLLLALPLCAGAVEEVVPQKLGFGGRLISSTDGQPITGAIEFTFSLYGLATGGTSTWTEKQTLLLTYDGAYGTLLGTVNPIPDAVLLAPGQKFLEVQVGNDLPLSPRIELGATPYAAVARHVRGGTVDATSITLNGAPLGQGYRGVKGFSANGSFVVPDGVTRVHVRAWGGGGAGGTVFSGDGTTNVPPVAAGGGGGAYAEDILDVTPGATLAIEVGTGGTVVGSCAGTNGGASRVLVGGVAKVVAGGGMAGEHAQHNTCCVNGKVGPRGGAGGTATGAIAIAGEAGWDADQGGGPGNNPMSPVFGRGGDTVYTPTQDPNTQCTMGDPGKAGMVLLAY